MFRNILLPTIIFLFLITSTLFLRLLFPSISIPIILPTIVVIIFELPYRIRYSGYMIFLFVLLGGLSLEILSSEFPGYYFLTTFCIAGCVHILRKQGILRSTPWWLIISLTGALMIQHGIIAIILGLDNTFTLASVRYVAPLAGTIIGGVIAGIIIYIALIRIFIHEKTI